MGPRQRRIISKAFVALSLAGVGRAGTTDGPLAPAEAARSFRLEPGLRVELVAAEPLVVSPVAIAFDERGRLYVAENRGYPTGPAAGEGPVGRIAMLEDTDRDGRMDRRTDFAVGLTFPNGLLPWKGGLIVTCAPDVLYLRDTDGDGKADERKVLFTGFATAGSTQLRVSHPTLSVDNWVYLTSGLTGGAVHSPTAPDRPAVVLKRTDFRFRPDGDTWEAADGGSQFGLTFDDAGHRFICYNRVQVQHVVMSSKDLRRNPHLAFSETVQDCPAETVAEPLKGHGAAARIYPISRNVTTADSHAGTFTAACGVTVFRGNGLPALYRGGVFSCDPTGNLVHFDRLVPSGATFKAVRSENKVEFLASPDNWFRPVVLAHGPDGALYVGDMYRKTIEHPDYLPAEIRKRTDFEGGKTMGRVWRVVRDDAKPEDLRRLRAVNLGAASTPLLCETLRHPEGWWRETAHRLLLERRDQAAAGPLRSLIKSGAGFEAAPPAVSVVHALHLLSALDAVPDDLLRLGLQTPNAATRENALRLVEPLLADDPDWLLTVLTCTEDADPRVRFQAVLTLGAFRGGDDRERDRDDDWYATALARFAARDGSDRWARAALFSALSGRELVFLDALRRARRDWTPLSDDLLTEFGRLLAASRPRETWPDLVRLVVSVKLRFEPEEQAALLTGLCESARGTVGPGGVLNALAGTDRELAGAVRDLAASMAELALDSNRTLARRRAAVGLLAFADFDQAGEALRRLIDRTEPAPLQTAAVRALGAQSDPRAAGVLLSAERFAKAPPALRDELLAAVLSQPEHLPGLLSALEGGQIPVATIDAARRRQLTANRDADVRRRAEALFGAVQADRAKVYDGLKEVITWKADPARGRAVFRRECASCHRLDREGTAVGPDLFGVRNQPKEAILLHIVAPDQEITSGFAAYTVATRDGRVLTGLIASENPESLTLRQPLGKEDVLQRVEIDELRAGTHSLMPEGLEKTITPQEFADLLAYLKGESGPDAGAPP